MNNRNNNNENDVKEKEGNGMENPFLRKSVIVRSPPTTATNVTLARGDNSRTSNVEKLGEKISKLIEFLKTRSNVHKDIVTMSRDIQAVYMQMSDEMKSTPAKGDRPPLVSKEVQTEEVVRVTITQTETPKRKRETTLWSPKGGKTKRKKESGPKKVALNTDVGTSISGETTVSTDNVDTTRPQKETEPNWTKVRRRARQKKRPARPDALVIQTCGESSYADILKKVKSDPKLGTLGENVRNIRKTVKGELLLELNKSAHQDTGEFRHAIEEVLGTHAEVRVLTHEILLEIKDMDEVTTKEDVHAALVRVSEEFGTLQPSVVKSLRKAYGGTQTATIGLSAGLANKLIRLAKVRIGWVQCRIREKLAPRRCYKCLDFGHVAIGCRSGQDHTGKCLRCGETGHKIKTCKGSPSCVLCKSTEPGTKSDHITGCTICPYYQNAVRALRK